MEYPINHMACIVSFLVCPEVVVVIHERDKTIAGEYETVSGRWLVQKPDDPREGKETYGGK
jgi:hypothetical protein